MQLIRRLNELPDSLRGGAVTIGNFDGVHRGHARIVEQLLAQARQCGGPAVVFTFDPHPVRLMRPDEAPAPLTWTNRKAGLLADLQVDGMVAYPTDEALLTLLPEEFFQSIVVETLGAKALVEGPNFFFGRNRAGNVDRLAELCREHGVVLDIVQPVESEGKTISSSRVRELVRRGHVRKANDMLTHPYCIRGMVTHGVGRGAKLGFPTANLDGIDTLLPAEGVYAARAWVESKRWPAAVNIGPNPTFGGKSLKIEVHVVGFEQAIYGNVLEVDFLARLRDIQPFASVDALLDQMRRDVATAVDVEREAPV